MAFCGVETPKTTPKLHAPDAFADVELWQYLGSRYDQINHLAELRASTSHYSKHPQDMQVSTIKRVDASVDNFFGRCKDPKEKKKGYPKFKRSVRSLTWSLRKHKLKTGERVRQNPIRETGSRYNRLKVPKLGEIKIRQHRRLLGDPKEVTLKKTRGWYCFIVCEVPDTLKCVPKSACGVDVGIQDFLTTSEGEKTPNPRFYRQAERKLVNFSGICLARRIGAGGIRRKTHWQNRRILLRANALILSQKQLTPFSITKGLMRLLPRTLDPVTW